ncbi:unnamed protein product [Ambrosiozyma monospora]|uniref:Unnamed protein product n=1 Tax=Ambrosiozyma monospora TaxID=43982 RepID=A0ACB5T3Y3_AMBMO|nr:unnamed protein product [Ambrosiozyma monospora]
MKEIARKVGIQWKERKYAFTFKELDEQIAAQTEALQAAESAAQQKRSKKKGKKNHNNNTNSDSVQTVQTTTFVPEDILALVPVVKNSIFGTTLAEEIWEGAKTLKPEEADTFTLLQEAASVYESVYGVIHPETAFFYEKLAQVYLDSGFATQAVTLFRKAAVILERTTGADSHETLLVLTRLAQAELANGSYGNMLKLYRRVVNRWSLASDEFHPSVINALGSISIVLQKLDLIGPCSAVLNKLIDLSSKAYGEDSQITAYFRFQVAQILYASKNFKNSEAEFDKALSTFKNNLGSKDRLTFTASLYSNNIKQYFLQTKRDETDKISKEAKKFVAAQQKIQQAAQAAAPAKSKKNNIIIQDPTFSDKSVDDIMKFIEGGSTPSKSSKKKGGKKKGKK